MPSIVWPICTSAQGNENLRRHNAQSDDTFPRQHWTAYQQGTKREPGICELYKFSNVECVTAEGKTWSLGIRKQPGTCRLTDAVICRVVVASSSRVAAFIAVSAFFLTFKDIESLILCFKGVNYSRIYILWK